MGVPKLIKKILFFQAFCVLTCLYVWKLLLSPLTWLVFQVLEAAGLITRPPLVVRTPDSCFDVAVANGYPFPPHYLDYNGVRVHYVDEHPVHAQHTLLLLHGEPSWSFLYRHMIPILSSAGYRVIAPDFIGFGKSDKYTTVESYSHEMHTDVLKRIITVLDLRSVTMVVQDWGGLTGLSVLKDPAISSRVESLVIMNTGLPGAVIGGSHKPLERLQNSLTLLLRNPKNVMAFLTWRMAVAVMETYLPVGRLFKLSCRGLPEGARQSYDAPFHIRAAKAGAAKWPLLVPIFPLMHVATDMQRTADFLSTWQKPTKVFFYAACCTSHCIVHIC